MQGQVEHEVVGGVETHVARELGRSEKVSHDAEPRVDSSNH